jgi:uncharacterized membrane protein
VHHFHHEGISGIAIAIVIAIVGISVVLLIKNRQADGVTTGQEKGTLSFEEIEVLTFLRKTAHSVYQADLILCLPACGTTEIAKVVADLERRGLITRVWDTEKSDYSVEAARSVV